MKNAEELNTELLEIEGEINDFKEILKGLSVDKEILEIKDSLAASYCRKAGVCIELSKLSDKAENQTKALECFENAINYGEKSTELGSYMAQRGKLYAETGQMKKAIEDISKAADLSKGDSLLKMFSNTALSNLNTLIEAQKDIKESGIDNAAKGAFTKLAGVTTALVLQAEQHGEILSSYDTRFLEDEKKIDEQANQTNQLRLEFENIKLMMAEYIKKSDAEKDALRQEIALKTEDLSKKYDEMQQKIKVIEKSLSNINFELLEKLDANDKLSEAAKNEIEEIRNDPCKLSFYHSLIWQMNSLYLASTVITTDMVENQKKGAMGNVGTILKTVADCTPLVGVGVKIIGEILVSVDKVRESKNVENYSKFVDDSVQMSTIAESVARQLALSLNLDIVRLEGFSKITNAAQIINDNKVIQTMYNVASSADTATIVGSVYDSVTKGIDNIQEYRASTGNTTVLGYARRFIFGPDEENDPVAKGESKAKIVVKYIAGKIFDAEINGDDLHSKIEDIVKQVSEHESSLTKEAIVHQDESKVAEVKLDKGIEDLEKLVGTERLKKIEQKAGQGAWYKELLKYGREVEEYLDEAYIKSRFKAVSPEEIENIRIVMFKHICMGINLNNNKELKCAEKFAETYSDLVVKIANKTPDFFVNDTIQSACISKPQVISKLNPVTTTLMVYGIEYDNPEVIEDLYQNSGNHVDPVISDLIELLGNVQLSSHIGNFGNLGDC